jgi:hypothetical protein
MKKLTLEGKRGKLAVGALVATLGIGTVASVSAFGSQPSVQEKIDVLLGKLKSASDQEMATGQLEDTPYGRVFAGESAKKMEQLHEETQKQIDALGARPESERRGAVKAVKSFAEKSDIAVNYTHTSKSSYNANVPVEMYVVDKDQYEVDARNNTIIQFGPRPLPVGEQPKATDETPRYSYGELEAMARQFIAKKAPDIRLDQLTPRYGNKENVNYFFRWEDTSREVEDMHPFIQVGFSRGGSLLSYANSLGL